MQDDAHANRYDDIIDLPRPVSGRHPAMSAHDRAAQFSPFAALTGYGAAIAETGRLTDERVELDEHEKSALNEALLVIKERIAERPVVTLTYFLPDGRKDGGAYVTVTDAVVKLKAYERRILLAGGETIPFDDITVIEMA